MTMHKCYLSVSQNKVSRLHIEELNVNFQCQNFFSVKFYFEDFMTQMLQYSSILKSGDVCWLMD